MDTIIYFLLCVGYLILLFIGIHLAKHHGWKNSGNVLMLVILALIYDNGILALGKYFGEGDLLKTLNLVRYWLHAFFTPLLVLFAWHTLTKVNLPWTKTRMIQWLVVVFTLCLMLIELTTVVWGISLESSWKFGVLSYRKVGATGGPPIMIISVSIILLITSIIVWWREKWPWYCVGVLFLGIIPIGHFLLKTGAFHNISEFILMVFLLATKAHQDRISSSSS